MKAYDNCNILYYQLYFKVRNVITCAIMKTFEELYDEVEGMDIAEPACMDMVLAFMEELHEETQEYMQLLVEKLEHAMITWKQPWYQEPYSVLKVLKNDDNEEASFLLGVMTKQECDLIEKNWLKFRKIFDVPDKLACFARWKNRDSSNYKELNRNGRRIRHLVCAFLARGLQRSTRQVYRHVVKRYGRTSRGIYTEKELKIIDICFHHDPKRAPVILSEVLARDPRAIYNRLHSAINGKPQTKRIKWNMELATKLLKLLIKITGEPLLGLKNKPIGIDVWRKLEEDFETKGEYLRHFWYTRLHGQLFIKYDVTLRRLRKKVFKILQRSPYQVWTDINWKEVAAELPDGFTYQLVYWVTVRVFRNNSNHFKFSMEELVNFGLERACSKKYGNKRLKTLVLTDEDTLEEIMYNQKI